MHAHIGDEVVHPQNEEQGQVIDIQTNPACLMRTLVIRWSSGEVEELAELEFGPLDDDEPLT